MIHTTVSMRDLFNRLPQLDADEIILDVRSPAEFAAGHVPGSRNIPHDELDPHANELKKFKRVYLHCRSGKRAQFAAQVLADAGLDNLVCISGSGMEDWTSAGFPVEKE